MDVLIVGAGIGGLTLALELHDAGIPCRLYEATAEIAPIGAGVNVLPHASALLSRLGLRDRLAAAAVTTRESVFMNRFGQLIHREPAGLFAGYPYPQFSIHRGDLQGILLDAVRERIGPDAVVLGHRCTGFEQDGERVTATFDRDGDAATVTVSAAALVGCDGIHSVVRKQLNPDEGPARYSGVNMWRGVTVGPPFLTGASMLRAGWLTPGKMVVYPIRDDVDGAGNQLVNWVAEVETELHAGRDWNRPGRIEDFIGAFEDWRFEWLDVPALIRSTDKILEYPMVDQDPLPRWSVGRVTLLGDSAHPMYPRGSNGAGQAILDARALRLALESGDVEPAFAAYDDERRPATAHVVETNRVSPPDILLKEVRDRTGDKPFDDIADVISAAEIEEISASYKRVAGYTLEDVGSLT